MPFPSPTLHMVIYIFQCYSLNSSHLLLPQLCPRSVLCVSTHVQQIGSSQFLLVYFTGICTCHKSILEHFHLIFSYHPSAPPLQPSALITYFWIPYSGFSPKRNHTVMAFCDWLLPLLNGLGTLAESQLTIEVWVYFFGCTA